MKPDRKGYKPAAKENLMFDAHRQAFWIGAPPAGYLELLMANRHPIVPGPANKPYFESGQHLYVASKRVGDKFARGQGILLCEYALVAVIDEQVAA